MTDLELVEGVPKKIVMVGTSSMTLHQRFSRMPKPKAVASKPVVERASVRGSVRGRMRGHNMVSRRATVMRSEPVYEILGPVAEDYEEYMPVSAPVRRLGAPVIYRRPIEERVTLPPAPQVIYVPVPVSRNQRKPVSARGTRGRGIQRIQGQQNNVRGVVNHPHFKNRATGTAGRGGRGGHARGGMTLRKNRYPPPPKKSISQLDRELEDYMRKSKHPKIVI
ncbi:hypothetical protein GCK32_003849 [Trichostrongylus colubriformis]|uniref:Chromatin target of PRMT1 protein C-terminal domain-containing protein n=1 Tax=Trichostrongylus colubriformis TaxID=6319 RepID=A0AAN8FB06_TRICO